MKVKMLPGKDGVGQPNGISRVIENYLKYGSVAGIEFVDGDNYDLKAVHAGMTGADCDIAILHGIYFTGSYRATPNEFKANVGIVNAVRSAKSITVPSTWVAEVFQRDLRLNPYVVPHGIDTSLWDSTQEKSNYVLYNKNRDGFDVCNSTQMDRLAERFPMVKFVSTFSRQNPSNVEVIGVQPHERMKRYIERAGVYLSLTKETFGIGILEAMASGVPVLGWRSGGNIDIVKHGVNGYLAEPGDYDDLAQGLAYCMKYSKTLGKNGIDLAKQWTWENAIEKLYQAFKQAAQSSTQKPTVSVVIPCYNYAHKVSGAVTSALQQTVKPAEIIVVDDGSKDNLKEVINGLIVNHPQDNIRYVEKPNGGVATARNFGASVSTSKYLVFLDADDHIKPEFIATCVNDLEKDRSLHIAYTGLEWVRPNGEKGLSNWPGEWNYDKQLERQNQVPTCCMIRRDSFMRLGGYRQRYAPDGAGSEDADLWTRFGAYGMKARKVTDEGLFVYSLGTGYVSGNKNYHESDWLKWHTFVKNKQHPFASYATPQSKSHKVYEYDLPTISIVIPVGPGHADKIVDALDSIEAQTYKYWEVVVVWDSDEPVEFDGLDLLRAYPYVRLFHTPNPRSGPGKARNMGVANSRGTFVVFLDADDFLDPEFLERCLVEWNHNQSIVYTDYYGISTVEKNDLHKFGDKVVNYNEKSSTALIKYKSADYNCELAQKQPASPLYHWCIVTCLIPKAWHNDIGGYDEGMESWEDVDYHWRMARAGKCYTHVNNHLVYYRFNTGTRRSAASADENRQVGQKLLQYMKEKYERIKTMACTTCGGSKATLQTGNVRSSLVKQDAQSVENMNDSDYLKIQYAHPNSGEHPVYGPATGTFYGYRSGGDTFLVHKNDANLMPHLFVAIEVMSNVVQPEKTITPTPPPQEYEVEEKEYDFSLMAIPGVTDEIATLLVEDGFTSWEKVKEMKESDLVKHDVITKSRAKAIMNSVRKMAEKHDKPD